ncbi:MAG: 1-acyl-sn-glycerol-3-phosphate acyltransferase [Ilumatobacter sp.]|jgi:1-acyl-sn-glycerol-3-phosphate acyltransferase
MPGAAPFEFEPAPKLPGADRLSKYLFGGVRNITPRLWDFEIEGRENVPTDGPAIITPNHLSFCDSVFVPAALPRRVWAVGKGEYMDSWKTKHLFPAMGMIPVDRSGGDAAQAALDTAADVLDNGLLFMIYPEGTRSRSGNLHKGRTGAARLALRCNSPVVPVGHEGTLEVQPPDTFVMKTRKRVVVRFGKPMWVHEYGDPNDPRTLRRFTDAVMFEISQLSGQSYVDTYASKDDTPATEGTPAPVAAEADASEQQRITPRRPSVVGSAPRPRTEGPSHINSATPTQPTHIRPPSGRPSAPRRSESELVDASPGPAVSSIARPPGRRSR